MPPISLATTYAQESPGRHKGFEYTRSHNPTRYALERCIAAVEGSTLTREQDPTCGGFAFSSGLAAMATALELLEVLDLMTNYYLGENLLGLTEKPLVHPASQTPAQAAMTLPGNKLLH